MAAPSGRGGSRDIAARGVTGRLPWRLERIDLRRRSRRPRRRARLRGARPAAGASVAIVERPLPDQPIAQLIVDRASPALADAACWWYEDPSHALAGRRDHRHRRQDHHGSSRAPPRSRPPGSGPGWSARPRPGSGGRQEANEAHATTPSAPILQAALRGDARRRRPDRDRGEHAPTASRSNASAASPTTSPSSPTSRTSTSNSTARGRRTATPSCRCSSGSAAAVGDRSSPPIARGRRPASSTPTTHPPGGSSGSPRRRARGSSRTAPIRAPMSARRASARTATGCASR